MDVDQSPEQKGELPTRDISLKEKETNNVGEVRRKVQEMTWKEGQPKPSAEGEEKKDGAAAPAKASEAGKEDKVDMDGKKADQGEGEGGKDLKRKSIDRNESSILEPLSPKRIKETPSVCP